VKGDCCSPNMCVCGQVLPRLGKLNLATSLPDVPESRSSVMPLSR
jgi:hypothetical protein